MKRNLLIVFAVISTTVLLVLLFSRRTRTPPPPQTTTLSPMLSAPFLQLPTQTSVRVVWFTEFPGSHHTVAYGEDLKAQVEATTTQLSRLREDGGSKNASPAAQPTMRSVWRHEAIVSGLTPGKRVPYQVTSVPQGQQGISSNIYTLAPKPSPGSPLKILLTSDHQLMPMTAANLQKVVETIGRPDAVFIAGDLINIPDRASEWFDDERGGAFFPSLQGRARYELEKNGTTVVYQGGEIIQHAPLFPAVGNHEVMGRFSMEQGLNDQFNDPFPQAQALEQYAAAAEQINPGGDPLLKEAWLRANSFNTDTYEEIFTLPQSSAGGERYYAVTFGDVRLVVLFVTNIWRSPRVDPEVRGRYQEREEDLDDPQKWGYGQHIFEPIAAGSPQYRWLQQELASPEFEQAKYKVVMFHHPPHTLGDNIVPPYTDPVPQIDYAEDGSVQSVRYDYPPENDFIVHDLIPLLESAGVQLVYYGHSHLWNRFKSPQGTHYLESSNVGNTYGAYLDKQRPVPEEANYDYAATGDPNGLEPIVPTEDPLVVDGQPQPYIASNDITVFSILDTENGTVSSYRFNTLEPDSSVVLFDQFSLRDEEAARTRQYRAASAVEP